MAAASPLAQNLSLRHQLLAEAWVRVHTGRVSPTQTLYVMHQWSVSDLERLLAERGVTVK